MRRYLPLCIVLFVYFLVAFQYASRVPAWQAPDEPAHYNYVRQLAVGDLPVIELGDYDQAYLEEILGAQFAPGYGVGEIEYEDWQPPLYYLLLTPVFWLTGGSLLALRLMSVLFGGGVVVLAYLVAVELLPQRRWLALTTAVFVAFLPQHLSILASVNNDSLAELLIAATLLLVFVWLRQDIQNRARNRLYLTAVSVLLGLGLLTKLTAYLLVPVVVVVTLLRYWGKWDRLFRAAVLAFTPAFLLGSLWWVRNLIVYPGFDPLAMAAHNRVVVGQPRTAEWVAQFGLVETVRRFVQTSFNSFWGQFGWMAVPLPGFVYRALLAFTAVVVLGLLLRLLLARRAKGQAAKPAQPNGRNLGATALLLMALLTAATLVYYNLTFVQHQGRYLFPALVPIGIGVALGLELWLSVAARLGRRPLPTAVAFLLPVLLGAALVTLDLVALNEYIVPCLTGQCW